MQGLLKLVSILTFVLSGCSVAKQSDYNAGNIDGFNHTEYSISDFNINGVMGSTSGTVCCAMIPKQWTPELRAYISWKTINTKGLVASPGFKDVEKYKQYREEVNKRREYHEAIVPIAQYDKSCGLQVHFLPCNEVKVVSSCYWYGMPEYPIQAPAKMKEPAVCPK